MLVQLLQEQESDNLEEVNVIEEEDVDLGNGVHWSQCAGATG